MHCRSEVARGSNALRVNEFEKAEEELFNSFSILGAAFGTLDSKIASGLMHILH